MNEMEKQNPMQSDSRRVFEPDEDRSPTTSSKDHQRENQVIPRWSTIQPFIPSSPVAASLENSHPARTVSEAVTNLGNEEQTGPISYFPDFEQREPQGAYVNYGDIYNIAEPSLFSCFRVEEDALNDATQPNFRSGRRITAVDSVVADILNEKYIPYAKVENKMMRRTLLKIVDILHFLDAGFAEYFRTVIPPSDHVTTRLSQIREAIHSKQTCKIKYVGELGSFIHMIDDAKKTEGHNLAKPFRPSDSGDDALAYLQEALEVPYWSLIANVFISSCVTDTNSETSITMVLRVVNDCTRDIGTLLQYANGVCDHGVPSEVEDGIKRRLKVLDRLVEDIPRRLSRSDNPQLQLLQQASIGSAAKPPDVPATIIRSDTIISTREIRDLDKLYRSWPFIVSFVAALSPAFVGFAQYYDLHQDQGGIGSFSDPDWKWMLSGFILTVPGNLSIANPLLKITKGTTVHRVTWGLVTLSVVCNIVSIAAYSSVNRCWTSTLSFIGNLFSISSVFFVMQEFSDSLAPNDAARDLSKVKND